MKHTVFTSIWNSVMDVQPKRHEFILACKAFEEKQWIWFGLYMAGSSMMDFANMVERDFTHWMPIPKHIDYVKPEEAATV